LATPPNNQGYATFSAHESTTNFCGVIAFVTPDLVHLGSLIELDATRDDRSRVNLPSFHTLEKWTHIVVHVGLAHLHRDALTKGCDERRRRSASVPIISISVLSDAFQARKVDAYSTCFAGCTVYLFHGMFAGAIRPRNMAEMPGAVLAPLAYIPV
jgi:hypothetical protein